MDFVGCSFFFQAEDGIRDLYVTGVQTCALPISKASFATTKTAIPAPQSLKNSRRARSNLWRGAAPNSKRSGSAPKFCLTVFIAHAPASFWQPAARLQ